MTTVKCFTWCFNIIMTCSYLFSMTCCFTSYKTSAVLDLISHCITRDQVWDPGPLKNEGDMKHKVRLCSSKDPAVINLRLQIWQSHQPPGLQSGTQHSAVCQLTSWQSSKAEHRRWAWLRRGTGVKHIKRIHLKNGSAFTARKCVIFLNRSHFSA